MLQSISLDGYRLLDGFTADLGQLTVVIGSNASGKSTLLDAFGFVRDLCNISLKDAVGWHGGIVSLLSVSRSDKRLATRVVFDNRGEDTWWSHLPASTMSYEVVLQEQRGQVCLETERLHFTDTIPANFTGEKLIECAGGNSLVFSEVQGKLVPFDQAPSLSDPAKGASNLPTETGLVLERMRFPNEFPALSFTRNALFSVTVFPSFNVSAFSLVRINYPEIHPGLFLLPDGSNLGAVLHEIFTRYEHRDAAEHIKQFVKTAYPFITDVTAETAYSAPARAVLRVRENGFHRGLEIGELSDGMLRFLCLATALLTPAPKSLVCVDEPETGLHPKLLPIVADMIKLASERTQVLITTHSPELLNHFTIDNVAAMIREDERAVWHRPGSRNALRRLLETVSHETLGTLHASGELEAP